MALQVTSSPEAANGHDPLCTVQLLSLGDTFACISRLADQTKPETSPTQPPVEVCHVLRRS